MRRLTLLTIGLMIPCLAHAADWPRFRGPNGTGVADDKNIPVQFNEKKGILWKVPIVGLGNSWVLALPGFPGSLVLRMLPIYGVQESSNFGAIRRNQGL